MQKIPYLQLGKTSYSMGFNFLSFSHVALLSVPKYL